MDWIGTLGGIGALWDERDGLGRSGTGEEGNGTERDGTGGERN